MPCSWCKDHYYDDAALYTHMERVHYHCHICRREDNHAAYNYFDQYSNLEAHFEAKHHLCPFDSCRAAKFVVFANEGELKRHAATEHGAELQMKRHERRAAMTLEGGFLSAPRVCVLSHSFSACGLGR
jgi:E3 ubiquitin-protein ligase ZNF598